MGLAPVCLHSTQSVFKSQHSQQLPTFSFGSASLQGCTINVYQAPYQLSHSEAQDIFEGVVNMHDIVLSVNSHFTHVYCLEC